MWEPTQTGAVEICYFARVVWRAKARPQRGQCQLIGFMVWMWHSIIIVLMGGEINAEMEHQTARDTTDGVRKPMGARGARMADDVGEARA